MTNSREQHNSTGTRVFNNKSTPSFILCVFFSMLSILYSILAWSPSCCACISSYRPSTNDNEIKLFAGIMMRWWSSKTKNWFDIYVVERYIHNFLIKWIFTSPASIVVSLFLLSRQAKMQMGQRQEQKYPNIFGEYYKIRFFVLFFS